MKIARVLEGGPPVLLLLSRETCVGYVIVWQGVREGGRESWRVWGGGRGWLEGGLRVGGRIGICRSAARRKWGG